jgi:hypothetical protein
MEVIPGIWVGRALGSMRLLFRRQQEAKLELFCPTWSRTLCGRRRSDGRIELGNEFGEGDT